MNVVLCFIGKMPSYIIECVTQLRLFFSGPLYIIYDDMDTTIVEKFNVILVHYDTVKSSRFEAKCKPNTFSEIKGLIGREQLFKRSYERFYLIAELIKQRKLKYIWHMEIDNLLYVNPNIFLSFLEDRPCVFSYHRPGACIAGVFYVRDLVAMEDILVSLDSFKKDFIHEMAALDYHQQNNPDTTLFPLLFPAPEDERYWKDFSEFSYIFDGVILGIYYFGLDPYHTNGQIVTHSKSTYNIEQRFLNIWKYGNLIWENENGILMPYFEKLNTNEKIPVANLHIHSKNLKAAISYRSIENT